MGSGNSKSEADRAEEKIRDLERQARQECSRRQELEKEIERLRAEEIERSRAPPPAPLGKDWRAIRWDKWEEMLAKVKDYRTDLGGVPKFNLLLTGAVGSGKSSFINTVASMVKGRISMSEEVLSSTIGAGSITKKFRIVKPGGRRGCEIGFNVCDTMGIEESDGLNLDDLPYVLDGHVPNNYAFDTQNRMMSETKDFIKEPTSKDKMHCLAYIVDCTKVHMAPKGVAEKFERLRKMTSVRGMAIVILVTHIDEMCEEIQRDLKNAHKSVAVRKTVDEINRITGLAISSIFLFKNYCDETEINADVNALNLTALVKMLDFADDKLNAE